MAWKGLHLTKPSRLFLSDGQFVVAQDGEEIRLPPEDLAWVVLDSPQTTLTGALLSACMKAGVAIVSTDETHTPSGVALPFHRHFRQAEMGKRQAEMSVPLKKRLWQKIVRTKISNQASALEALGREGAAPLRAMTQLVGSGDPSNVEARAARHYWKHLFADFRRDDDGDRRNMMLNYGYAVARSGVARALVATGLLPCFGLSHASITNAFNLADDLFEPFRPVVDVAAWRHAGEGAACRQSLSVEDHRTMAAILHADVRFEAETISMLIAAERASESLCRAIEHASPAILSLPEFAS